LWTVRFLLKEERQRQWERLDDAEKEDSFLETEIPKDLRSRKDALSNQ